MISVWSSHHTCVLQHLQNAPPNPTAFRQSNSLAQFHSSFSLLIYCSLRQLHLLRSLGGNPEGFTVYYLFGLRVEASGIKLMA